MKRAADVEPDRALGAGLLARAPSRARRRPTSPLITTWPGRVVVRRDDEAGLRASPRAQIASIGRVDVAENGRHRAGALHARSRTSARRAAGRAAPRRRADSASGGVIRGELAERMARGGDARVSPMRVAHDGPHRRAVREQRRLRVVRERQLSAGPSKQSVRERIAERGVRRPRRRRAPRESASARSFPIPGFCEPCPGNSSTTSMRSEADDHRAPT